MESYAARHVIPGNVRYPAQTHGAGRVADDSARLESREEGKKPATFDARASGEDTTHMKLDRIQVVPGVCEGRPTIRGLRITVEFVLKLLADGYVADEIVREYPEIEKEDVYQAARFGAWLAGQRTSAVA